MNEPWMQNGSTNNPHRERGACEGVCRPVVVIDPDDTESAKRLSECIEAAMVKHLPADVVAAIPEVDEDVDTAIMLDGLREYANPTPPKPYEPKGLGAVVEDARGRRFVHSSSTDLYWYCVDDELGDARYADIDVVRVLSEGVTP